MLLNKKGVSVIICCYNSASRLPETLRHLSLQKVPANIPWEVIIVNNASTDNTVQIAATEWANLKCDCTRFEIVDQPVPGLSFAREKGEAEAQFEYLILCDDDNWLCENYVENAFKGLERWPTTAIIGGNGTPRYEIDPPEWFAKYSSQYATGGQNSRNGIIDGNCPYVYGAGSVIRKSVLEHLKKINFKTLATDRLNDKLSSGGDVELCYAVKLLGYDIAYDSDLEFFHFIQKNRLTNNYLLGLVYQFGCCDILHRPYFWLFKPELPKFKKSWLWTLIISINIFLISLIKSFKKNDPLNAFICEVNLKHSMGRLITVIKLNWQIERSYRMIKRTFNRLEK